MLSHLLTYTKDFKAQKGYMQRLDPSHPLDFFIGINEKGYDEYYEHRRTECAERTGF